MSSSEDRTCIASLPLALFTVSTVLYRNVHPAASGLVNFTLDGACQPTNVRQIVNGGVRFLALAFFFASATNERRPRYHTYANPAVIFA